MEYRAVYPTKMPEVKKTAASDESHDATDHFLTSPGNFAKVPRNFP